jgi:L-amino acid N-acyltransferase YncA
MGQVNPSALIPMHAPAFIRPCFEQDLESVAFLAGHHALTGFSMLEEHLLPLAAWSQRWSRIVRAGHPFLVACLAANPSRIIGFAYTDAPLLGAGHLNGAAIELHGAVTPALLRHGVGGEILRQTLHDLKTTQTEHIYVCYGSPRDSSEPSAVSRLLRREGFGQVGKLPGAARKFGRPLDLVILARAL